MTDPVSAKTILYPLAAHLALVAFLYAWLTVERARNVLSGRGRYSDLAAPGGDHGRAVRVAANLGNQFELPALFYPLVLTLYVTDAVTALDVALGWAFTGGRALHTGVQTLTANVPLRGFVFSINAVALAGLWAHFLWNALG